MALNEDQKKLYNFHLAFFKRRQNKPYTLRVNFDNFEKEKPDEYVQLVKLDRFFRNHDAVNKRLFFEAPYKIFEDREYFDIGFYNSQAAIKCYTTYLRQMEQQDPDCMDQCQFIIDSLIFIKDFCCENKITVINYLKHKEQLSLSWAVHLAEHKTSFYVILGYTYFGVRIRERISDIPPDELDMLMGTIVKNYDIYQNKLDNSEKAKKLVKNGIEKIDKLVNEYLKNVNECDTINK